MKLRYKIKRFPLALFYRIAEWCHYERIDLLDSLNGREWKKFVWDFDQYLRSRYKYHDEELAGEYRDELYRMLNESGLNLDD